MTRVSIDRMFTLNAGQLSTRLLARSFCCAFNVAYLFSSKIVVLFQVFTVVMVG